MEVFDKVFETLPSTGWLTKPEARLLWNTASLFKGPILEVGCFHGRSTVLLAALGRPVYTVDSFDNFDSDDQTGEKTSAAFIDNLVSRNISNVWLSKKRIRDWERPRLYRGVHGLRIEFAYLDGDHTYQGTRDQISAALRVGAKTFCVHDCNDNGGGLEVKNAVLDWPLTIVERVERMAYCVVSS